MRARKKASSALADVPSAHPAPSTGDPTPSPATGRPPARQGDGGTACGDRPGDDRRRRRRGAGATGGGGGGASAERDGATIDVAGTGAVVLVGAPGAALPATAVGRGAGGGSVVVVTVDGSVGRRLPLRADRGRLVRTPGGHDRNEQCARQADRRHGEHPSRPRGLSRCRVGVDLDVVHDGSGAASSAASSSRSWNTTPASTRAMPPQLDGRRALVEDEPADDDSGDWQQGEQQREAADGDAPQDVLVDAVADGVGEHADEQAGEQQTWRSPHVAAAGGAERGEGDGTDRPGRRRGRTRPGAAAPPATRRGCRRPSTPRRRGGSRSRRRCRRARRRRAPPRRSPPTPGRTRCVVSSSSPPPRRSAR